MQKYYPISKLNKNSLLYGNLKDIANSYFFNSSTESYTSEVVILQDSNISSLGLKNSINILSIPLSSLVVINGLIGLIGNSEITSITSSNVNGSKNSNDIVSINEFSNAFMFGNKSSVDYVEILSTTSIQTIGSSYVITYNFNGNVSISSNQSLDVQGLKSSNNHINIYQLTFSTLYGLKNSSYDVLIAQSNVVIVERGSSSKPVQIISHTVRLKESKNNSFNLLRHNSSKSLSSIVKRKVRIKNDYINQTRRNS